MFVDPFQARGEKHIHPSVEGSVLARGRQGRVSFSGGDERARRRRGAEPLQRRSPPLRSRQRANGGTSQDARNGTETNRRHRKLRTQQNTLQQRRFEYILLTTM